MKLLRYLYLFLTLTISMQAMAQYTPENPPEPEGGSYHKLSAIASPAEGGSVYPSIQKIKSGQAATVTASPYDDYSFVEWRDENDSILSVERSYRIIMPERDVKLKAIFRYAPGNPGEPDIPVLQSTVNTIANPPYGGNVTGTGRYEIGSQVNIYAYPNSDYVFTGWTLNGSDLEDMSNPLILTVSKGSNDLTGNFRYAPGSPGEPDSKPSKYPLTLICSPSAGGTISPSSGNRYEEGENVALTAHLNSDYQFEGWTDEEGSVLSLSRNFTFTMPAHPATITAAFRYAPGNPGEPDIAETARNIIYGNRATVIPGSNAIFTISLLNIDHINGINVDLQLPDGPLFDLDAIAPGQRVGMHSLSAEPLDENGAWRLKLRSDEEFAGGNGTLLRIPVIIPAALENGSEYEITLSHGVVFKTDGSQESVNVSNGMICLSSDDEPILNSSDFIVSSIEAEAVDCMPGDVVSVSWTVLNSGNKDALGGWSESLFLTDSSGRRAMLGTVFYDGAGIKAGESVSRSASMVIPRLPGISGRLNVGVSLLPYLATDEPIQLQANNTALSDGTPITLGKRLILTLPDNITEGIDSNIRAQIARSGSWAETEVFTLSAQGADPRIGIPSSVIIPREQSAAWFRISLSKNDTADIPSTVELTASGENYESVTASMTVKDSHLPKIGLLFDPEEVMEGQTVNLTVSIPYPIEEDVSVNLSSVRPDRIKTAESVVIPALHTSAVTEITAVDNKTIDGHQDIAINATAHGFEPCEDYLFVIDNDMPDLEMSLSPEQVSENAGPVGIHGIITRTSNLDQRVTLLLSADDYRQIMFATDQIVMQPGQTSVEFSAGIYDNDLVDGNREVEITAAVFVSTCSCSSIGGLSGSVSRKIFILDNDGPSLSLTSPQSVLAEGDPDGILITVKRNADLDKAITVTLSSDSPETVKLPKSVIIPQNQESASFKITATPNDITDDDRTVVVSANADGYASSNIWMMVTDRTLPDARIPSISLSVNEAKAGSELTVDLTLASTGVRPLPAQTCIAIYADDAVLDRIWLQEPLEQGMTKNISHKVTLPLHTGPTDIYALANYDSMFKEINSSDNYSSRIQIMLTAPFSASVSIDRLVSSKGNDVMVKGSIDAATCKDDKVEIYVINDGLRRTVMTEVLPDRTFEAMFTPLPGQGGHFSVGACYPEEGLTKEMASFEIPEIKRTEKGFITCEAIAGTASCVSIGIMNPCAIPMTGIKAKAVGVPEGCLIEFNAVNTLEAGGKASLEISLTGTRITDGKDWEKFNIIVESAEGAVLDLPFYWYCKSPQASLLSPISNIEADLPVGKTIEYPITVTNNGAVDSGMLELAIPAWMKTAGPTRLPSLAPGESTIITLRLSPSDDMLLNQLISGRLAVNCENGTGLTVNYKVMPVSDMPALLEVSVCDEFTYNTAEAPKVEGAKVKVVNPGNGKSVAEGYSDVTGIFTAELSAGYYQLEVSAEKHDSWTGTVFLNPGKNNSVKANISFNPITLSYNVVPTEIEDEYSIEISSKYETNLPVPIVRVIAPERIDGDNMKVGESTLVNIQMVNEGLMTAFKARLIFEEDNPEWTFEPLDYKEPCDLAPHQTVTVPVKITRIAELLQAKRVVNATGAVEDMVTSYRGCMTHIRDMYEIICGDTIWKDQTTTGMAMKMCATAATMAGLFSALQDIIGDGPALPGGGGWVGGGSELRTEFGYSDQFSICDPCDAQKANNFINLGLGLLPIVGDINDGMDSAIDQYQKEHNNGQDSNNPNGNGNDGNNPNGNGNHGKDDSMKSFYGDLAKKGAQGVVAGIADIKVEGSGDMVSLIPNLVKLASPCDSTKFRKINTPFDDIPPSFNHSWQEVFFRETKIFVEVWQSILDIYTAFYGDPVWVLDKTPDKLEFMKAASSIKQGTVLTDEEIMSMKPESVSLDLTRAYLDRILGVIDIDISFGDLLDDRFEHLSIAREEARSQGFDNNYKRFYQAYLNYGNEFEKLKNNSVCASIGLRFSQTMTMTREAFRGTLEVFNGHENTPMRNVRLNLAVTNESGTLATAHEFQINPETLNGFNGELILGSTWTLDAGKTGTTDILFIPTRYAAPNGPAKWSFGGSISYLDPFTNLEVTRKIQPVTLTVNPSPTLDLTYFLQRDVYADDPLTAEVVESSERAEFALVIRNAGEGDAKNVTLSTPQPQIIDNEKGILLEASLHSSQLNGEESNLAIGENIATAFGDIPSNEAVYAQWWFESSLAGHFTDFDVKATHVSSYGNPDLSLLGNVEIHELIRGITDPSPEVGSSRRLFLTNEITDANDLPDMVYYSDGSVEASLGSAELSAIMTDRVTCLLSLQPLSPGWVYGNINDPTGGRLKLKGIVRLSDGVELPVDNCWQTSMTFHDGNTPLHEDKLHITVNTTKPETYRLVFEDRPNGILYVHAISGIPSDASQAIEPVKTLTVCFSKEVNPDGFTSDALHMTRNGQAVDVSNVSLNILTPVDYTVTFDNETLYEGFYTFTVDAARVKDAEGFAGDSGKNVMWLQNGESLDGISDPIADTYDFSISPIPVRDTMTIKGRFSKIAELNIFNATGQRLARWTDLHPDSSMSVTVPVKGVSSGVMIVTATTDNGAIFSRSILCIEP